ncbi:hypothetical protein JW960_28770 [candidate division KSB1 bacterium]|nr:hypothetical protein [candidate division KSB1 bacterium]
MILIDGTFQNFKMIMKISAIPLPESAVSHRRTVPMHRNTNVVEGNSLLVFNEIMSAVTSGLRQAQASVLNINSI